MSDGFFFFFFSDNFTVSLLSAIADACIRASYKRTLFLLSACPRFRSLPRVFDRSRIFSRGT